MTNIKTFVIDTNVILDSPNALLSFDENILVIPDVVIEELDKHKNDKGETGYNSREAIRYLEGLRTSGDLIEGVVLPNGGMIKIDYNHVYTQLPETWDLEKNDNRILRVAKAINGILVSKDMAMRIKASIIGVVAEDYKSDNIQVEGAHKGRLEILVDGSDIDSFYDNGYLNFKYDMEVFENDYILLKSYENKSALGFYKKGKIYPLKYVNYRPYDVEAKNIGQKFAIDALMRPADEIPLVIIKGPAGTAKTFIALAVGLEKVLNTNFENREYRKILITRGNVKMDNDIGYLKGDEQEKIMPLLRSFTDNLEILVDRKKEMVKSKTEYLFDSGIIDIQALAYMRGRTLTNTYLVVDEAQNLTPNQVLSIVTRVGEGSKVVLIGDPDQIDNAFLDKLNNGLVYASEKMKDDSLCAQVTFKNTECTRSAIAKVAAEKLSPKGVVINSEIKPKMDNGSMRMA